MKDEEIINLWKLQETKLEQTMALNLQLLKEVKTQKAESALRPLTVLKSTGVLLGIIYLVILGMALFVAIAHYSAALNYFIVSIGAIFIINVKAIADYIKHLVWINSINYNGGVVEVQEKLTRLYLSIITHTRFMFLQLPFWTTFYLSSAWFPQNVGMAYVIFQIAFTALFAGAALWLYKNINLANADKKWFRMLMSGSGGKEVVRALEYYQEIEEFKH